MGEFRIGRTFARHSYPDTPRGASAAFARNYAVSGQDTTLASPGGTVVFGPSGSGGVSEAGAITANGVPITARVTGDVAVRAMVNLANTGEGSITVEVFVQVDGVTIPNPFAKATLDGLGNEDMPVIVDLGGPVGTTVHVNLLVVPSAGNAHLTATNTTLALQELPPATG